jgi:hypothetical protein
MNRSLLLICMLSMGSLARAQSAPPLGSAQSFAVLGNTTVTSTGLTAIKGDVGVSTGTAVTGFGPGTVTGGTIHSNDATAVAAQADAHTAYADLAAQTCGKMLSGDILGMTPGAVTLSSGVYCFPATSAQLTGTLTLNGPGVYIFQIGTTLTTAANSAVVLTNGATAENVFWQVGSSATLGADTALVGTLIAVTSDTVTAGSSVYGRVFALGAAVTLDTNVITASPVGRWEIVHTSGDSPAQLALYPGSFSTFLNYDGTGYTYGTFTNSICVIDAETNNVVPTWTSSDGIHFVITITVDNLGLGNGNLSFIYTGAYDSTFPVPGGSPLTIPAISGTYISTGNVSACSVATPSSPGNFVATFLPTISSGTSSGSLEGFIADHGSAFDAPVIATITFGTPPAPGQIAGTVSLASNPTFHGTPCFATTTPTSGVVVPLTINANLSSQSGTSEYMFAEGVDPNSTPTTLFLNGFSANVYSGTNTDRNATLIDTAEWAVDAAIGQDNPAVAGGDGVSSDGTNTSIVALYGVLGGVCDNAGGVDAPFHFLSGTPIHHKPRERHRRGIRTITNRENDEGREN